MEKKDKTAVYLTAIVGVVAAVGILVLLANLGTFSITGQAYGIAKMKDPPDVSDNFKLFLEKNGINIPADDKHIVTSVKPTDLISDAWYAVTIKDDFLLVGKIGTCCPAEIKKLTSGITPSTSSMLAQANLNPNNLYLVQLDSAGKMKVYSIIGVLI